MNTFIFSPKSNSKNENKIFPNHPWTKQMSAGPIFLRNKQRKLSDKILKLRCKGSTLFIFPKPNGELGICRNRSPQSNWKNQIQNKKERNFPKVSTLNNKFSPEKYFPWKQTEHKIERSKELWKRRRWEIETEGNWIHFYFTSEDIPEEEMSVLFDSRGLALLSGKEGFTPYKSDWLTFLVGLDHDMAHRDWWILVGFFMGLVAHFEFNSYSELIT